MINKQEFTRHYVEYYPKLLGYINKHCTDKNTSEDIAQEVWVTLNKQERDIENVGSWCIGVAKNLLLHYWRQKRNSKIKFFNNELHFDITDERTENYNQTVKDETIDKLKIGLGKLPSESQRLLRMKYVENKTFDEMSLELGKKSQNLRVTLSRIRQNLREFIKKN